jgi:hypothetical protein
MKPVLDKFWVFFGQTHTPHTQIQKRMKSENRRSSQDNYLDPNKLSSIVGGPESWFDFN